VEISGRDGVAVVLETERTVIEIRLIELAVAEAESESGFS
jgi:hypothetical protein